MSFNEVASYAPKIHIKEELSVLSASQVELISLVSGLTNGRQVSIATAAKKLGISPSVAVELHKSAILTLREGLES